MNKERRKGLTINSSLLLIDDDLSMINLNRWLSASHLSKWAWGKGYYWHSKVCVLCWPSQWNRPGMKIKKKYKCDDFTFPIVNVPLITSNIPAWPARMWCLYFHLRILITPLASSNSSSFKRNHVPVKWQHWKMVTYGSLNTGLFHMKCNVKGI